MNIRKSNPVFHSMGGFFFPSASNKEKPRFRGTMEDDNEASLGNRTGKMNGESPPSRTLGPQNPMDFLLVHMEKRGMGGWVDGRGATSFWCQGDPSLYHDVVCLFDTCF